MATKTVMAEVDIDEFLEEVSDQDLRDELARRKVRGDDAWGALGEDIDFQMAIRRGDRDAVFRQVSNALRVHPVKKVTA